MGLRDKMQNRSAEISAQRQAEEEAHREQQIAPVRSRIAELTARKTALEQTMAGFASSEQAAQAALGKFKETKQPIDQIYEEFPDAAGESKTEFIRSNEDEPEVQAFRSAGGRLREEVRQMREFRKSLRSELSGSEDGGMNEKAKVRGPSRSVERASGRSELERIDRELAELKLQTPEGQAEHKEKIKTEIAGRIKHAGQATLDHWRNSNLVYHHSASDLIDKYDPEVVRELMGQAVKEKIAAEFDQRHEPALFKDLDKLVEYAKRAPQTINRLVAVKNKRNLVQQNLRRIFAKSQQVAETVSRFGITGGNTDRQAEKYLEYVEEVNLGTGYLKQADNLAKLEERLGKIETIWGRAGSAGTTGTAKGYGADAEVGLNLPVLEVVDAELTKLDDLYEAVATKATANEVPLSADLIPRDRSYDSSKDQSLFVRKDTFEQLGRKSLGTMVEEMQQTRGQRQREKDVILDQLEGKFQVDWAQSRVDDFAHRHKEISALSDERKKAAQSAVEFLRQAPDILGSSQQVREQEVIIHPVRHNRWSNEPAYELLIPKLYTRTEQNTKRLEDIPAEIASLERQIREKGVEKDKAWRQRTKDKVASEIQILNDQKNALEQEGIMVRQQQLELRMVADKILKLQKALGQTHIGKDYIGRSIKIGTLLAEFSQASELEPLDSEKQSALAEYERLVNEAESVKKVFVQNSRR